MCVCTVYGEHLFYLFENTSTTNMNKRPLCSYGHSQNWKQHHFVAISKVKEHVILFEQYVLFVVIDFSPNTLPQ